MDLDVKDVNTQPLVSIVMPAYNSLTYIQISIDAIINQTYLNWELLITDDCSIDETYETIKEYELNDERIKVFRLERNSGAGLARNNSIKHAKGRFIAFCDSDDKWGYKKLESQIDFMLRNDVSFSYSDFFIIDEKDNITGERRLPEKVNYEDMLLNNYIGCLTAVYDVEKLGKIYMKDLKNRQDWLLWLDLLKKTDYAYNVSEKIAYYRERNDSISSNKIKMMKFNWLIYYKYEGFSFIKSSYYIVRYLFMYLKKIRSHE